MNFSKQYQTVLFNKSISLCKNIKLQIAELEKDIQNLKNNNTKTETPPAGLPSYLVPNNNPNRNWSTSLRN